MQVFIKDCISSDLTSFVTSSGDVAAGFTGEADQESAEDLVFILHLTVIPPEER